MVKPTVTAGVGDRGKTVSSSPSRSLGLNKDDGSKRRRGKKKKKKALQFHHLPHDILGDILSRLSFKEAARMSVLSSRWRRLWTSCNIDLVFTRKTMLVPTTTSQARKRADFIRNVNSVLCQLSSTTPRNKFVLKFEIFKPHARRHVDRWVAFCAASRAKHIVFDFNPGSWDDDDDRTDWCSFPLHHFSNDTSPTVRSLRLMSACLNPPPPLGFCGFTNLRKLKLDSVSGDIQCLLLPACSVLEWLSIVHCTLHSLTTSQPLCQLRYLCVQFCKEMHKLEVQAPNLATFMFGSYHPVPFVLDGCVEIQEVTVTLLTLQGDLFDYAFTELPGAFPLVRELSMRLAIDSKVHGFAKCSTRFVNLRHLILTMDVLVHHESTSGFLRLACLLELAPVLEQLELHMECCGGTGEDTALLDELPPPHRPHDHLKIVHMTGIYGYNNLLNLALHFARNAVALERMVIDPVPNRRSYVWTGDWIAERGIARGRRMAREHFQGLGLDDIVTIL